MYVVKDLVPDMNNFYQQYKSIQPWLQREDEKSVKHGEQQILQSTTDRSDLNIEVIWLCQELKKCKCPFVCPM